MASSRALPVFTAARAAAAILQAWEDRNLPDLRAALHSAPAPSSLRGPGAEAERTELLESIVREFRSSRNPVHPAAGADAERIEICVGLLRHLVATESFV